MVKGEKDAHRRMLHGSAKSITQENKFKLLKNNGKRDREEASKKPIRAGKVYRLRLPLKIQYHSEQDRQWNFTVY